MGGSAIRPHAARKTVSLLDMLGGHNLLGISVDDSRENVISTLGNPKRQNIFTFSEDKNYKYNDLEVVFDRDDDLLRHIVLYGKGRKGKFRLPWFVKDRGRIRRDISYDKMIRLLQSNGIQYYIKQSVGDDEKRIDIRNGEIIFTCTNARNFQLYSIYFSSI